jgi:hypothetical protein
MLGPAAGFAGGQVRCVSYTITGWAGTFRRIMGDE